MGKPVPLTESGFFSSLFFSATDFVQQALKPERRRLNIHNAAAGAWLT
jgi:hypothetical protein